jgi:hypothetical protein
MAFTTKQISDLNRMNKAASQVSLGTTLNDIVYGSIPAPATGAVTNMSAVKYTTAPALGTATATKAALTLTASAQTGVIAGITQPDFARALSIKGNASMTGNVVIHGTDIQGNVISDTIALNNSSEVLGVKAFATVTSIDYPAETNSGTDTISVGRSNRIGLPCAVPNVTCSR